MTSVSERSLLRFSSIVLGDFARNCFQCVFVHHWSCITIATLSRSQICRSELVNKKVHTRYCSTNDASTSNSNDDACLQKKCGNSHLMTSQQFRPQTLPSQGFTLVLQPQLGCATYVAHALSYPTRKVGTCIGLSYQISSLETNLALKRQYIISLGSVSQCEWFRIFPTFAKLRIM